MAMTADERKENNSNDVIKSAVVFVKLKKSGAPPEEIERRYNSFLKNAKTVGFSQNDVDFEIEAVEEREVEKARIKADKARTKALNENPLLEKRQIRAEGGSILADDREQYAEGGEIILLLLILNLGVIRILLKT